MISMTWARAGLAVAGGVGVLAGQASATWSIIIVDTRTGEVAAGSATCLERLDLRETTPVLIAGLGAATAQASVDSTNRNKARIRDLFLERVPAPDMLAALEAADASHQSRQYGIVDVTGAAATFSGSSNFTWAGGVTGRLERGRPGPDDDIVYAIQGNILVGPEPVLEAERAIRSSRGDVADMLMSGMIAAREWGGDGRCSCGSNPTGCGAPPPEPFKSADIGYMLIARAGDKDASPGLYDIEGVVRAAAAVDLDADGWDDLLASPPSAPRLYTLLNARGPDDPLTHFQTPAPTEVSGAPITEVVTGDFTGDGVIDVAVTTTTPPQVVVLPRAAADATAFGAELVTPVAPEPTGMVAGDLDGAHGTDLAIVSASGTLTVLLSDGLGGFAPALTMPVGTRPRAIDALDMYDNGVLDLVVADSVENRVIQLFGDGAGGFAQDGSADVDTQPVAVELGDLDGDGLVDIATTNDAGRSVTVLLAKGDGAYDRTDYDLPFDGADLELADLTGDGVPDLIATNFRPKSLVPLVNDGSGVFEVRPGQETGSVSNAVLAHDFGNDGLKDVVVGGGFGNDLLMLDNQGDAFFTQGLGFASGAYFMEFNVANARRVDPDPVDQMADLFVDWRMDLVGRADAVQSTVAGPDNVLGSGPGVEPGVVRLRVTLRDWGGGAVDGSGVSVDVRAAPRSVGSFTVIDVSPIVDGAFDVLLEGGAVHGDGAVVIDVHDARGAVRLMPNHPLRVFNPEADFNGDGRVNFLDLSAFLQAFREGDPAADLNQDGALDFADVSILVSLLIG